MEGLFESELKGQNGCRIYIVNSEDKREGGTGLYPGTAWAGHPAYDRY